MAVISLESSFNQVFEEFWDMFNLCFVQILEEINNADSGAPCSPRHLKKKHFIDAMKKSLQSHGSSNKAVIEAGAITCVKLCKESPNQSYQTTKPKIERFNQITKPNHHTEQKD